MKNNSLAMIAVVAIALGIASIVGYIDPAVCAERPSNGFITCEQAAAQHLWGFIGFTGFGVLTLVGGSVLARRNRRK